MNEMEYFEKSTRVGENGCLLWVGGRDMKGYGVLSRGSKRVPAHRWSYETFIGPILPGFLICHKCDNPPCCNPSHLFQGTHQDNNYDKVSKGRQGRSRKLREDQVVTIRQLRKARIPRRVIADMFKVHTLTIEAIDYGKTWKWLK